MSYHIYTTEGIILKRTPFGEANLLLHVLTKDLGLIIASAQSSRVSASKLRPLLQEYSFVILSCIKGKNGWKITNVSEKSNFFFGYPEYAHPIIAQMSSMLIKMMPGEESHSEVFEIVQSGFEFFKSLSWEQITDVECIFVLRILYCLGYVVKDEKTEGVLDHTTLWSDVLIEEASKHKLLYVERINRAFTASQL